MAFKRKRIFRKKRGMKKIVKAVVKAVEKREEEHKYIDFAQNNDNISYSGTVYPLSRSLQGTANSGQRIGDRIKPMFLSVLGRLVGNGANVANATNVMRLILFIDRQPNGALPTPSQVLQTTATAYAVYSHPNSNTMGRFHFLVDKLVSFDQQTLALGNSATTGSVRAVCFKLFRKLSRQIVYQSNNGDITDCLSNHVFLLAIGNVNTNDVSVEFTSRITFTDS